jgi:adenylate cyclase
MFGSEMDAEAENSAIYQNLELDILRLTQRVSQLERALPQELIQMKELIFSKNKEQQFYIETLHKDFETIEKARVKMYKEEESERAKLLEDVIKIYEKTKENELKIIEFEKKMNLVNEKIMKIRSYPDKRPISPMREEHGCDTTVGTPRRGQGANGSGDRSTVE